MSMILIKYLAYGILSNIICCLGLLGNTLTLYIMNASKDMRRQSINIYLTVLALYDNGVLIFSILMLNLPAITDYQQQRLQEQSKAHAAETTGLGLEHASLATNIPALSSLPLSQANDSFVHFLTQSEFRLLSQIPTVNDTAARLNRQLFDTGQPLNDVNASLPLYLRPHNFSSSSRPPLLTTSSSSSSSFSSFSSPTSLSASTPTISTFTPEPSTPSATSSGSVSSSELSPAPHSRLKKNTNGDAPSFITSIQTESSVDKYAENILECCLNMTESELTTVRQRMVVSGLDSPQDLHRLFLRTLIPHIVSLLTSGEKKPTIIDQGACFKSLLQYHSDIRPNAVQNIVDYSTDQLLILTLRQISLQLSTIPSKTGNNTETSDVLPETLFEADLNSGQEQIGEEADFDAASMTNYPLIYYVKFVYPMALFSQTGSIWTTCLITIERYLAVCHPLMSRTLSTRSRAITALMIMSAAALLFNLTRFFEVDTSDMTVKPTELRHNKIYYHVYYICLNLTANYIVPLSLLSWLNIKIYSSVRHAANHRNELTRARQGELHLASMLVMIVAIFIACNAPAFVVNCLEQYLTMGSPFLDTLTVFSNVLVCFNSAVNFVIYCIFGKKFRSKLRQVLGLGCCFEEDGVSSQRSIMSNGRAPNTVRLTFSENLRHDNTNGNANNNKKARTENNNDNNLVENNRQQNNQPRQAHHRQEQQQHQQHPMPHQQHPHQQPLRTSELTASNLTTNFIDERDRQTAFCDSQMATEKHEFHQQRQQSTKQRIQTEFPSVPPPKEAATSLGRAICHNDCSTINVPSAQCTIEGGHQHRQSSGDEEDADEDENEIEHLNGGSIVPELCSRYVRALSYDMDQERLDEFQHHQQRMAQIRLKSLDTIV